MRWMVSVILVLQAAAGANADHSDAPPEPLPVLLDLATAQRRALADNPSLKAAATRVSQARERVKQAFSLYLPQIEAAWTATHTELPDRTVEQARQAVRQQGWSSIAGILNQPVTDPVGQFATVGNALVQARRASEAIEDSADSFSAGVTARLILFDGFSRRFTNAIARFGEKESEAARDEAARLVLDAVARGFYGVQLAVENIEIARTDQGFNERLLKEAEARKRVGTGSLSDVLNFEVRLRAAQAQVIQVQRDLDLVHIGLAALMGLPEAAWPEGTEAEPLSDERPEELQTPAAEDLVARAKAHRPDVERSRYGLERAGATVGQRRAVFFPQVSAFASHDATRSEDSDFREDDFASSVGVNLSVDLFTGGRNRAALREARYAREEAEDLLAQAELDAAAEVREAAAMVQAAQAQLLLQRDTAGYVQKNRDLVEKEYQAGQAPLVRLNEAQRDLVEAQGRLALARVSLRQAWHQLRTSTAETLTLIRGAGE
jgi:outer membrane protein TolC